ncbi:MAG: DoxX family protein [Pseudomonadota bacterium]
MTRDIFFLEGLGRFADIGPLTLRVLTGAFLVYGVVDNVASTERMQEFSDFLATNLFPAPDLMALVSVYIQLACGVGLVLGLLTRLAGIVVALHFVVAVVMVHWSQDFRGWWPAIVLVAIGIQFALIGAGKISLDAILTRGQR